MADEPAPGSADDPVSLDELVDALKALAARIEDSEALEADGLVPDGSPFTDAGALLAHARKALVDVEQHARREQEQARETETALFEEQQRLEKLWNVYKSQETELEQARQQRRQARQELGAVQERVQDLEEDLDAMETSRQQAREEKARLQERLREREKRIEQLEPFVEFETEIEEVEDQLDDERTRLAKLYAVFEQVEEERDELRGRLEAWKQWADEHGEALEVPADATGEVPPGEGIEETRP